MYALRQFSAGWPLTVGAGSLILVYHSIGSTSPAAIPQELFRQQMDTLRRTYGVVSLTALLGGVGTGQSGLAAVTGSVPHTARERKCGGQSWQLGSEFTRPARHAPGESKIGLARSVAPHKTHIVWCLADSKESVPT